MVNAKRKILLIPIDIQIPGKVVKNKPPCCGQCYLSAETVQLYFWPSTENAATPTLTSLPANVTVVPSGLTARAGIMVNDAGFTL
jgi:hypothetical protein